VAALRMTVAQLRYETRSRIAIRGRAILIVRHNMGLVGIAPIQKLLQLTPPNTAA
jgi:hypothetical protein